MPIVRRATFAILGLAGAAAVCLIAFAPRTSSLPLMAPAGPASFGKLTSYASVDPIEVAFRNTGRCDVYVHALRMGCGCISAVSDTPASLHPGETLKANVKLDVSRIEPGVHTYALNAVGEDGTILGKTTVSYQLTPFLRGPTSPVYLQHTGDGTTLTALVPLDVVSTQDEEFLVKTSSRAIRATVSPSTSPAGTPQVNLTIFAAASNADDLRGGTIEVWRAANSAENAVITVVADPNAGPEVVPSEILLDAAFTGDVVTRQIDIGKGSAFRDSTANAVGRPKDSAVSVSEVRDGDGLAAVVATFRPTSPGLLEGSIRLTRGDQILDIPYVVPVRARKAVDAP